MRLINVHTLGFEEFEGQDVPKYAILSHRWGGEEVLFKDMINGTADQKSGIWKIRKCCDQAQTNALKYVWIDTCCIDKSSSAELSEAINTMFGWYQNAQVCYVYLFDLDVTPADDNFECLFKKSVWFTRGWTLQELIAPRQIEFYNSRWLHIGDKDTLQKAITDVTSIFERILTKRLSLSQVPIAQRMSWAANRQTTRIEDRAYSLMGIFDVNMPMLYGEGDNAMRRLQEEIVRRSNDHSILLFQSERPILFASSPSEFNIKAPSFAQHWGTEHENIWPRELYYHSGGKYVDYKEYENNESSAMTNLGLSVSLPLSPWYFDTYIALVAVTCSVFRPDILCFIYLRPSSPSSSKMFRITWRNESVKLMSAGEYTQLYSKSPYQRGWLADNTKRIVIASTPLFLDRRQLNPRGDILLEFERSPVWGTKGFLDPWDVLSRSGWKISDTGDARLHPEMPYETISVFRVKSLTGQPGHLYITYDRDFDLFIIYKEQEYLEEFLELSSSPTLETLTHILQVYQDIDSLWSLIKNNDDNVKLQVIKMDRSLDEWESVIIHDLGIKVSFWSVDDAFGLRTGVQFTNANSQHHDPQSLQSVKLSEGFISRFEQFANLRIDGIFDEGYDDPTRNFSQDYRSLP